LALVDCGLDLPESREKLDEGLARLGLTPGHLTDIFVTHAHPDHIGGCAALPKTRLYAQAAEAAAVEGRAVTPSPLSTITFAKPKPTGLHIDRGLKDGEQGTIGIYDITALAVPGHTPGSGAYLIGNILFAGDAAAFDKDGKATSGPWIFNSDGAEAQASIKALAQKLPGNVVVATGHTAPGTAAALK
jgi:glyoxylase-like metal-dependent hydrolase (beta-lactamase superfamily II)